MIKKISFLSLQRQWEHHQTAFRAAIDAVLESQQFIGGSFVEQFEREIAQATKTSHAISCNSGTDALWMALDVLNVAPKTIVLTTPFSFIASSSEIIAHGGHPVFIDIDPATFNICPTKLAAWLEQHAFMRHGTAIHRATGFHITGIVSVNLFGQLADYHALRAVASAWNLWIVEDACQSIGSSLDGIPAGAWGDIGTLSFYPTKNLGAFGDAGAVTTHDAWLAQRLLQLRNHGRMSHYEYQGYGINSRLDSIQASILSSKLTRLEQANNSRRRHAMQYQDRLQRVRGITVPHEIVGHHTYHQFSITMTENATSIARDALVAELAAAGVQTRIFYPESLNKIPFLNRYHEFATPCPIAEQTTRSIVSLPIWPELTVEEIDYICDVIEHIQSTTTLHAAPNVGGQLFK